MECANAFLILHKPTKLAACVAVLQRYFINCVSYIRSTLRSAITYGLTKAADNTTCFQPLPVVQTLWSMSQFVTLATVQHSQQPTSKLELGNSPCYVCDFSADLSELYLDGYCP